VKIRKFFRTYSKAPGLSLRYATVALQTRHHSPLVVVAPGQKSPRFFLPAARLLQRSNPGDGASISSWLLNRLASAGESLPPPSPASTKACRKTVTAIDEESTPCRVCGLKTARKRPFPAARARGGDRFPPAC
jgi:hypothetical protein